MKRFEKRVRKFKNFELISALAAIVFLFLLSPAQALMLDLTTDGSSGFINGALFVQTDPQPTGTGYFQPFVRIHNEGGSTERGYNTDYRPVEFETKDANQWTHSITLNDVAVVNIGGVDYRQFLLDINETASNDGQYLSLDELEVYLGATGSEHNYPNLGTLIYDLDNGGDNWIKLNYFLNHGSGSGDMFAYIPDSLFTGPNEFVYLYSNFGLTIAQDAGFEEWQSVAGVQVPEPSTILLLGSGFLGLWALKRKVL